MKIILRSLKKPIAIFRTRNDMSHSMYTTEALVCGTFNRNTADRSYLLFTKEAGMLYAEARSVREERSRQRMALQDFSLVRVSLIKGKSSWKIGSIEARGNFFALSPDKAARGSVVSLMRFLRRFFSGQEAAPALFEYVTEALTLLSAETAKREFIESVVQVHILHALGYVDGRFVPPFIQEASLIDIAKHNTKDVQTLLETLIDKAVSTSHL
jgi:recombinational DNA repair protein (RecF pathway)